MDESPFHQGEQIIQQQLGVREKMEHAGRRGIRGYMPEQHREFFPQLPFVVVGSVDDNGQPWASLLCGSPGFVESPDPVHLLVHAAPDEYDPLHYLLGDGSMIGMLGIQLHTRRRNRLNGRVTARNENGFAIEALQSFGNCPKYIQARLCAYDTATPANSIRVAVDNKLDDMMQNIIRQSDMFFIATSHPDAGSASDGMRRPQHGVDVSHRGGKPGFVNITDNVLTVPDYVGNFFFNTLGNLLLNPRAGLVFIDFMQGTLLHLAVAATIIHDDKMVAGYPGAQRLLQFVIKEARHVHRRLPLQWTGWELSPYLIDK
ncbi:MAG: pyridoxamine 5'-phosphate oxidase family protein [Steroidobacter sp.]